MLTGERLFFGQCGGAALIISLPEFFGFVAEEFNLGSFGIDLDSRSLYSVGFIYLILICTVLAALPLAIKTTSTKPRPISERGIRMLA